MTVLLTTHYMEEADALCDRVALMHRGRSARSAHRPRSRRASIRRPLEDVFRHYTGEARRAKGRLRDVRTSRRTARRLG